jgi:hypothetical protein
MVYCQTKLFAGQKNKFFSVAKLNSLAAKPNISAAEANMVYCQTKHGPLPNQTCCRAKKQISVAKLNSFAAKPNISAAKANMVYCQTKHFSCQTKHGLLPNQTV